MLYAYYNENDPFAADWLELLIMNDLIAQGFVDRRSIVDVKADDLREFGQCHFFAGIGGWSYALRLAGVPDDRPVWTGSCPCQPFSQAGKQQGTKDERHLWPEFRRLINESDHADRAPAIVFGEQVASKAGRAWLSGVRADLEAMGRAVGAADLCSAGVRAPHIRQRLYWLAVAESEQHNGSGHARRGWRELTDCSGVGDASCNGREQRRPESIGWCSLMPCSDSEWLGDANNKGSQGRCERSYKHADLVSPWEASVLIPCTDDKFRRVPADETGQPEPALFPLAHGVPNRVGALRGSGNAINPWLAKVFIEEGLAACASV